MTDQPGGVNNQGSFVQSAQYQQQVSSNRSSQRAFIYKGLVAAYNPNSSSVIDEVAEEIGMFAGEKLERALSKRKAKELLNRRFTEIENTELAGSYANMGKFDSPEVLSKFLEQLRSLKNATLADVLEEVARRFPDVSDQYLALSFAEEALEREGDDPVLLNVIRQAKQNLMDESGPAVRAGINIVKDAMEAAGQGLGSKQELRDFYREAILNHEGIVSAYKLIKQEYGKGSLDKALSYLIKAAGSDMAAQGPSIEKAHLGAIVDNLYQVEVLGNIDKSLAKMLEQFAQAFSLSAKLTSEELLEKLLSLTDAYRVQAERLLHIADEAGARELQEKIYFLTVLHEQIRLIPLKVYPNNENREHLLEASQDALDEVIYEEEQEEEEEDEDES